MTRGKSSNAAPIPPARHEPAPEVREMGLKSAQRALCPPSSTAPKTHAKAEPPQQTVPGRKRPPCRRSLHRQEGRSQGHQNRDLRHGFQGKAAIGRVRPATGHPPENHTKEQSTPDHDATLQKPGAHLPPP